MPLTIVEENPWPTNYRMDPHDEYFRMTCLSIKTKLVDEDPDFMCDVVTDQLFLKCKKHTIPFHSWYEWIENQYKEHDKLTNLRVKFEEEDSMTSSPGKNEAVASNVSGGSLMSRMSSYMRKFTGQ